MPRIMVKPRCAILEKKDIAVVKTAKYAEGMRSNRNP